MPGPASGNVTWRRPNRRTPDSPWDWRGTLLPVLPWIIFAVVVVPLVVVAFAATRRSTVAREHPASEREDPEAKARIEQEFAEAEAYEAKWREEDEKRYRQERLP